MCKSYLRNTSRVIDSPYTTIYHGDLWVKNIMFKKGKIQHKFFESKALDKVFLIEYIF